MARFSSGGNAICYVRTVLKNMDDLPINMMMFAHNVPLQPTETRKWHVLTVTPHMAAPQSAVYNTYIGFCS